MPLVRIDLSKKHSESFAQQVGDIVYNVMREQINVPEDDKFQIITRHDVSELNIPKSYLGIEYSESIIFIQATISFGRSIEIKKKLYKAICETLVQKLKVRSQDVFINLLEVSKENWSFGNGEMQYADKD
ncbi:tautomerase family protein [Polynucleobacter sp. JS-JIR-II-50]|uniref:tautomerase family protein n=1 Tax=Polynucleobacter sp. JS-JIR-II-50 TaxID=2576919 RepID=UPI001BFE7297|nr:tautomerase family protein [Polynucleobacter sp. JS-JIR-II-50]QWE04478.1 tautomerase family protein [Polynucleobacter sp. JS-JIR-II-50]